MNEEINVLIPKDDSTFPFTCFAEGSFIRIDDEQNNFRITLKNKDVLILFFHFKNHRRLYITLPESKIKNLENNHFWNVSENRQILVTFYGRNFDRLKHSIDFIKEKTQGECFSFPIAFWSQLIMLIQNNRHSKINIEFLINQYKIINDFFISENK